MKISAKNVNRDMTHTYRKRIRRKNSLIFMVVTTGW